MNYMNILEKLQILIDLITSSEVLVVTIMLLGVALFLYVNGQLNNKKLFIISLVINVIAFLVLIIPNIEPLSKIVNNIIDEIFMNIYFPSVEVYLFIITFMFVIMLVSTVNFKMQKSYRVINISSFFVIFYLFLNLIYIILTKNIDIFNAQSIYTNKEAVSLLELSTLVYGVWIVLISINWISSHVYAFALKRKTVVINSEVSESMDALKENAYAIDNSVTSAIEETNKTGYSLNDYKTFNNILKQIIMLNRYKSQLTFDDLLDDSVLKVFSIEDQNLYVDMLNSYLK